jgi:hypothetical protein
LTEALAGIIAQLERQRTGIDQALAALREVEGIVPEPGMAVAAVSGNKRSEGQKARWAAKKSAEVVRAPRKGGMTPEGKKRLIKALKKRWAAKKAAAALGELVVAPAKATRKRGMTEDGRKRLAEAMKRRWAVKRAASAVKKRAGRPKKAA